MSIRYKSISIFSFIKAMGLALVILSVSCEDAEYELDNPFDPSNMALDPPALFFHPPEYFLPSFKVYVPYP